MLIYEMLLIAYLRKQRKAIEPHYTRASKLIAVDDVYGDGRLIPPELVQKRILSYKNMIKSLLWGEMNEHNIFIFKFYRK